MDCSCIAVKSASDLFTLFITQKEHSRLEREDFESCRKLMTARGATFLARLQVSLFTFLASLFTSLATLVPLLISFVTILASLVTLLASLFTVLASLFT